jgi:hypothetical protein
MPKSATMVLLFFIFVASSVAQTKKNQGVQIPKPTLNHCEMNDNYLDNAHHLAGDDSIIVAIAHLGTGETNPELNRRRLHNVRNYLAGYNWKRPPETVVTAVGERVDGYGRVDIYVRGFHWASLAVWRNEDLIVGSCEPDRMRSDDENRTFYPFRDRKKPR